jgi:predicted DNA-binding protein
VEGVGEPRSVPRVGSYSEPWVPKSERNEISESVRFPTEGTKRINKQQQTASYVLISLLKRNRTVEGVGEPRSVPRVGSYSEPWVPKSERNEISESVRFPTEGTKRIKVISKKKKNILLFI